MNPVPVLGWDAPRHLWLQYRRAGIGASDIAALLGLIPRWCTPWQLWAIKTGHLPEDDTANPNTELGRDLEPWIITQAPKLLGMPVTRTPHMLYRHGDDETDWQQCSPDAFADDGALVEAKIAKIGPSWGDPEGWEDDGVPLAYELQCRWQMHVMDRPKVYVVGLVAGLGLIVRTVVRHVPTELDLVAQVSEWRHKYLLGSAEPEVDGYDVEALAIRYAIPDAAHSAVELADPLAHEWVLAYKEAKEMEAAGRKAKKDPKAKLTALLGRSTTGLIDGHPTVTWNPVKGDINWQKMAHDLAEQAGISLPDPETYRAPDGRQFRTK